MKGTNAIELLESDHRKVESLFQQYRQIGDGPNPRREEIAAQIREELSVHAAIEELELYPVVRKELESGDSEADEALEEHQTVKETLAAMEKMKAGDPEFERCMTALEEDVTHHVSDEEKRTFPKLKECLPADRLAELGSRLEKARATAPTHPHPHAPNQPPGNVVAGPAAAAADKIRDKAAGR